MAAENFPAQPDRGQCSQSPVYRLEVAESNRIAPISDHLSAECPVFTGGDQVKLVTFAALMTAFRGTFYHIPQPIDHSTWRNCQSAPSEGRQHFDHRTFVEHYRLPGGTPYRIRVDQER